MYGSTAFIIIMHSGLTICTFAVVNTTNAVKKMYGNPAFIIIMCKNLAELIAIRIYSITQKAKSQRFFPSMMSKKVRDCSRI